MGPDLVVIVGVGPQLFGFPADSVREILRLVALAPVPGAPPTVRGTMNLRGTPVQVADLRVVLGLPARDRADTPLLVLEGEQGLLGLVVDEVFDVEALDAEVQRERPTGTSLPSFVTRVVPRADRMIYVVGDVLPALTEAMRSGSLAR